MAEAFLFLQFKIIPYMVPVVAIFDSVLTLSPKNNVHI
jgi:hypothetical protein